VHTSQLRDGGKKLADDPQHAFPGQGQMKPEQLEIARLRRDLAADGVSCGPHRIERLMRLQALKARPRRR
jgi:transposase InsO family protein